MKKILCAVDDCEHSKVAARLAGALAAATAANLTLLAVNELIGGYLRGDASARLWTGPQVRKLLDDAAAEAKAAGAEKVETLETESRDVARAISQFAEEHGYDHIVIGSGGKTTVKRMVLGSVSADIVNRAPCPVTVAR
ncbi:universal stress protein UspA [Hyphomicrobium nitrativorans NL23]|uniref:Universal stress protein UspA n=1 Tax=Hyphomicrobium nitrativorans NL23 TaxID=1029756 RepID=V5SB41_9HYPH|nr:universal stress protein [Hyphomicrobium nitrativorans]AHB48076.1 universal stress protein UspA [Hyphomicrobium nitrativorans NL23]